MYEKIKRWYGYGLWTASMVAEAARKGALTAEQAVEILGAAPEEGGAP